jgi:hypothetical protein
MRFSRLKQLTALSASCVVGIAVVGLSDASASSGTRAVPVASVSRTLLNCVKTSEINESVCLPSGPQGIQGIQGPQGAPGCSSATSNGNCTVIAYGNKIGPVYATGTSPTGSERYSVAQCAAGNDPEVYGGGGLIVKNGPNSSGDVVILEASFPGTYNGQGEVTPVTSGPSQSANAYEAKSVVSFLANQDNYTLQAYAVCGP